MGLHPVISAAIISGGASILGQSMANRQNRDLSNTAYQRAMADMKKAGLNPMLAYQKGGASTPQMESVTKQLPNAINSAVSAIRSKSEISQINSQTDLNEANTALSLERANSERANQGQALSRSDLNKIQSTLAPFIAETGRIAAGGRTAKELNGLQNLYRQLFPQNRTNLPGVTGMVEAIRQFIMGPAKRLAIDVPRN